MEKQEADRIITEYLPKIYGFAARKCYTYDETEELSADIVQEVYLSLRRAEEVVNPEGYVWRISEHVFARYVAFKKRYLGVSLEGVEIPFEEDYDALLETGEEIARLRREIAFLTRKRREIVYLFYYENRTISFISKKLGMPEGTVKWHLNKARIELKEGFSMERKKGTLAFSPVEAVGFDHHGGTGPAGDEPGFYLRDKLNLNIVYSVYFTPRTMEEIAEEVGVTPVYLEDKVQFLEANGFLVRTKENRFTTFVEFTPLTYSLEQKVIELQKKQEVARMLEKEYVPAVREAVKEIKDVYIPGGSRELLEAAAVYYAICEKCHISTNKDMSKYYIKTTGGARYIARARLQASQSDTEYQPAQDFPSYWSCGSMNRWSRKYPAVGSWSVDTRLCSRVGAWRENLDTDYEYLYEFMGGMLPENESNEEKYSRLRKRSYLTEDNQVNIMVAKWKREDFFAQIPAVGEETKKKFAEYALESAMAEARKYPPQMQDLIVEEVGGGFIGNTVALMTLDLLYENGTFRPLTEREKVTSQLIMFSDILPA